MEDLNFIGKHKYLPHLYLESRCQLSPMNMIVSHFDIPGSLIAYYIEWVPLFCSVLKAVL